MIGEKLTVEKLDNGNIEINYHMNFFKRFCLAFKNSFTSGRYYDIRRNFVYENDNYELHYSTNNDVMTSNKVNMRLYREYGRVMKEQLYPIIIITNWRERLQ